MAGTSSLAGVEFTGCLNNPNISLIEMERIPVFSLTTNQSVMTIQDIRLSMATETQKPIPFQENFKTILPLNGNKYLL